MDCCEISLKIFNELEKALDLGFNRIYVNVDYLDKGFGFLRVLVMNGSEYIIVYENTFELDVCFQVLELLQKSEYDITDFTDKWCG